ncbi:tandem-95 repeat protein [Candidatus Woesearchaeota archaeon]|nr:tandem-95 repeat protein [Candidatus Woesearchaeota archaeon]
MRKLNLIWILALFLLIPNTLAYINCTTSACPSGYTDNGEVCQGSTCVRNCTRTICGSSWTQVHSNTFGWDVNADDEHYLSSTGYTPTDAKYCYNFSYKGPPASEPEIRMWGSTNPSFDCDDEMIGGFRQGAGEANPWFNGMSRYVGDKTNTDIERIIKIVRASAEEDSDSTYRNNAAGESSIYCGPTTGACSLHGGTSNCDTDCYNKSTVGRVGQGYYKDKGDVDTTLYDGAGCGGFVDANEYLSATFKVYETLAVIENSDQSCDRIHEAPSVSNVRVLPLTPNAGQDLLCNYTYSDPENFTEQNSSYEWWKNSVNQNINSQTLANSNLTPGDSWYCKVTPSDGLLFGTQQQSDNTVTIRNATQNPIFYINNSQTWNQTGYFGKEESVIDFNQELNNALANCSEDAEGFCNVSLTFSSNNFGILNLSDFGVYYTQGNVSVVVSLKIDSIITMYSNSTLKIFEFVILNDGQTAVTDIQWQFDTNNNFVINSTSNISSLVANEKAFVYVQYNFSGTGSYDVKANATGLRQSTSVTASLSSSVGIGDLIVSSFDDLSVQGTNVIFEIQAKNQLSENISNVNWSLDTKNNEIINATQLSSLSPNETIFIFVNYDYGTGGTYAPTATVTNTTYSDTKTASVTTNTAPVITPIPDIAFNEDTYNDSLNLSDYVSDSEDADSSLNWKAENNVNVIVTINQTTKRANFTALANWSGSENVKFTVNDTSGLTANDTILITVNAINDAPSFNSSKQIPNMTWPEDIVNNSLNLSKYFYDIDGDALNYTSTGTLNITVYIGNNTGIVNLTPNANWTGINYVIFTAKDIAGLTATSNNVTLNVTPVNDFPTFTGSIPQWKWQEDVINASLNLTQYFSDIDGDILKYNFTSVINITILINNNTGIVNFTPEQNFNGVRYAVFTAIDMENLTISSNNVTLNVTPINDPPAINTFTPSDLAQTIVLGNSLAFNHTSSDVDGDTLTYSWKLDSTQKSTELGWTYIPNSSELGNHNVTLNVSDGTANATMQWNVSVINQSSINVYDLTLLSRNSTSAIFGFNINNTGNSDMSGINWSLNTGQETISANALFSLQPNESIFVFVSYNYSAAGDYTITASATNKTHADSESMAIDIEDIEAYNLTVVNESGTKRIFEFIIKNSLDTNLTNVNWTFDTKSGNVINATANNMLQPSEELFVYIDYNFTGAGTFNVNATARNGTLTDSRNLTITI